MSKFEETPQWRSGSSVEAWLDRYFRAQGWTITRTTPREERQLCLGDRHYRRDGRHLLIEYKSGLQSHETGNVFLETISVDSVHKPGWVYTCKADFIFYAALLDHKLLIFKPDSLRAVIEPLKLCFKEVQTRRHQNAGYDTHGVIVPLEYAERHLAQKVIGV